MNSGKTLLCIYWSTWMILWGCMGEKLRSRFLHLFNPYCRYWNNSPSIVWNVWFLNWSPLWNVDPQINSSFGVNSYIFDNINTFSFTDVLPKIFTSTVLSIKSRSALEIRKLFQLSSGQPSNQFWLSATIFSCPYLIAIALWNNLDISFSLRLVWQRSLLVLVCILHPYNYNV